MKKSQLSLIFIFAMVVSVIGNPMVVLAANDDLTFDSLYLSVRPEFDFPPDWFDTNVPAVLVVQIAELTNNTNEPITTISYPAPIDEPNFHVYAVGKLQSQGQYWPAPHVLSEGKIHIDLKDYPILPDEDYSLTVQYYYNPFTIDNARKSFSFEFAPDFNVKEVLMNVATPPAAKNVRIEPVKYALNDVKEIDVNKDNPISLDVVYDKADNKPANQPLSSKADKGDGNTDMLFILFVALLLIIVIIFIFSQKGSLSSKNSSKQKAKKDSHQLNAKKSKPSNQKVKGQPEQKKFNEDVSEEQKDLRKKLLAGEIDEKAYHEQMKKLNNK